MEKISCTAESFLCSIRLLSSNPIVDDLEDMVNDRDEVSVAISKGRQVEDTYSDTVKQVL